jgi:hypothetical protein
MIDAARSQRAEELGKVVVEAAGDRGRDQGDAQILSLVLRSRGTPAVCGPPASSATPHPTTGAASCPTAPASPTM